MYLLFLTQVFRPVSLLSVDFVNLFKGYHSNKQIIPSPLTSFKHVKGIKIKVRVKRATKTSPTASIYRKES